MLEHTLVLEKYSDGLFTGLVCFKNIFHKRRTRKTFYNGDNSYF